MPRDGSSVYNQPFPNVVADTVIESAVYNGFTNDVALDLNTPRPIVAGGTGAANAHDAMVNLKGEIAKQGPVTNYDSFPFVNGSFYSDAGATGAPTSDLAYIGTYYEHFNTSYATIEARKVGTAITYTRQKNLSVWGAWTLKANLDTDFVNVTGDTMTGTLEIHMAPFAQFLKLFNTTGSYSKTIRMGATSELEITNSAFSSVIMTLTDVGALTASGAINSGSSITATGDVRAGNGGATGTYRFGNTGTKTLLYDGVNYVLEGGTLVVNGSAIQASLNVTTGLDFVCSGGIYAGPTIGYHCDTFTGSGGPWQCNVITAYPNLAQVYIQALHFNTVWAGWQVQSGASASFQFRNDSNAYKTSGGATWVIISDARIKDVKGEYTTGLDTIAALRPVRFTYKGNHSFNSPETNTKADYDTDQKAMLTHALEAEYVGLIAQEAESVLPDCFKSGVGYVDGKKIEDLRNAEYTPLIFALVNAVKELKARVEELEAM
jgi:hypothetical protein